MLMQNFKTTTEQAARALRAYLTTGKPDWSETSI